MTATNSRNLVEVMKTSFDVSRIQRKRNSAAVILVRLGLLFYKIRTVFTKQNYI